VDVDIMQILRRHQSTKICKLYFRTLDLKQTVDNTAIDQWPPRLGACVHKMTAL